MVTPDEMRAFALDCLRRAELTDNASHRELMLSVAKNWMNTASAIERRFALLAVTTRSCPSSALSA